MKRVVKTKTTKLKPKVTKTGVKTGSTSIKVDKTKMSKREKMEHKEKIRHQRRQDLLNNKNFKSMVNTAIVTGGATSAVKETMDPIDNTIRDTISRNSQFGRPDQLSKEDLDKISDWLDSQMGQRG